MHSVDANSSVKPTLAQSGLRWAWLAVLFLVLDQASKLYVLANFKLYESVAVFDMFNLTYVQNKGAAFSFLSEMGGWQRWFFTSIAVGISALLIYWMRGIHASQKMMSIAYSLVLSGALGNLIDRVSYGYVVDFLDVYYKTYHWPVFNIADVAICVGAGLIILDAFTNNGGATEKSPQETK